MLKDEFKDKVKEITEINDKITTKYLTLVDQLAVLGCYNVESPKCEPLLDTYYNWEEHYDAKTASIGVRCNNHTIFYQYLQEKGILDKYFPDWYKKGHF